MAKEVTLWSNSGFDNEEEPNSWIIALKICETISQETVELDKEQQLRHPKRF